MPYAEPRAEHFGWYSIALAQALQFELLLSQKDVIGEWVPVTEPGKSDVIWAERRLLRQKDVVGEWIPVDEPEVPGDGPSASRSGSAGCGGLTSTRT